LKVSIVIPCYNEENIGKCIDSVLRCEYEEAEIIVVDDGSTDRTPEICKPYVNKSSIKYLRRKERGGPAKALNDGAKAASGSIIAVLNADSLAPNDWIRKAVEHFLSDGNVIAVGGPLKASTKTHWALCGEKLDQLLLGIGLTLSPLHGTNMFVRSDILEALGFYSDNLDVGEDLDLGFRLCGYSKRAGGRVAFDRDLVVFTNYPVTLWDVAKRHFWWGEGRTRVLLKGKIWEVKAWARVLYLPWIIGLAVATFLSLKVWLVAAVFALSLMGAIAAPMLVVASRLLMESNRQRVKASGFLGSVVLAYVRLISGSVGSLWALLRH